MTRKIEINTVRTIDSDGVVHHVCNDGRTCPGLHTIADRPGRTYVVVTQLDDDEAAQFAPLLGKGETVGWVPTKLLEDGI